MAKIKKNYDQLELEHLSLFLYFRCRISVCDLKTEDCSIKCPRSQLRRRRRRQIETSDAGDASTVVTSAEVTIDIPRNQTNFESYIPEIPENEMNDIIEEKPIEISDESEPSVELTKSELLKQLNELQIKRISDGQISTLEICLIAAIGFLALQKF